MNQDFLFEQTNCDRFDLGDGELFFYPHFYDSAKAASLFDSLHEELAWQQDQLFMAGRLIPIPRLQAWYGEANTDYTYSGLTMKAKPFNPTLLSIKNEIEALQIKGANLKFNSVLCNLYRDQRDSVAWHADDEPELGKNPTIASLSFGQTRRFSLRHNNDKKRQFKLELPSGSLLIMTGALQHHWQHQLAKSQRQLGPRINLTFRQLIAV